MLARKLPQDAVILRVAKIFFRFQSALGRYESAYEPHDSYILNEKQQFGSLLARFNPEKRFQLLREKIHDLELREQIKSGRLTHIKQGHT